MEAPMKKETGRRLDGGSIAMIVCSAVLALLMAGLIVTLVRVKWSQQDAYAAVYEAAGIIEDEYYFMEGDSTSLAQDAIRGMLSGIDDPYAAYYTAEEYDEMLADDAGDYQGIGISVLAPDETGGYIMTVYPDTPMSEAGAQAGDVIVSVNGTAAAGLSMDDFLALFSDEEGVSDTLVLLRGEELLTVTVTRREVHVTRVYSEMLDNGAGYVNIEQFVGSDVTEFWTAVQSLQAEGMTGLVIDLRNNPGGSLTDVLGIANYLLPRDALVCTIKSRRGTEEVYYAEGDERLTDMPLVVLVNGNSASASELLSGALQDHGAAKIVGTQTFGKGIVQSYYRLKNGAGWVKLTTDAYYTPNDVCIHGTGITPDYPVEQAEGYADFSPSMIPHDEDLQLQAALTLLAKSMQAAA